MTDTTTRPSKPVDPQPSGADDLLGKLPPDLRSDAENLQRQGQQVQGEGQQLQKQAQDLEGQAQKGLSDADDAPGNVGDLPRVG